MTTRKENIMSNTPTVAGTKPIVMTLETGTYYWCTCGLSSNQPFCNGAHKGTEFVPQAFTIEETKQVALCACKQTGNPPFCDGAHVKLAV
jgi:CDGSH iron-sulfur domain-containing protein 3